MRVGLIIYGRLDAISGGYLYDRKLVAYLRRQGDEVEVISLPGSRYGRRLSHNLSRSLTRRLRRAPFDLLLQDELNHPSLFWLNRRLRPSLAYPIVSVVHHLRCSEARPNWQNHFYRWIEQRYLNTLDGFIYNSQTTRDVVAGLMPRQRPGVVAYPAGDHFRPDIAPDAIVARAREPGPLRLIFVGNLIPRKGLHMLLAALARLPADAWRLTVVGETAVAPTYARAIQRQLQTTGLVEQVTLLGPLPDDALAAQLRRSQALVVPSDYEGFGIVYLEGMGVGLPAIATTAGAAHEIITHERDGFLLNPGDTAALARHIRALHQDRDRLVTMSLAARQRYLAHPTWDESMARVRRFLLGANEFAATFAKSTFVDYGGGGGVQA